MDDAAVLDLNDFFYFVQVVDRSGFTAAGRMLRIPKSTLRMRIPFRNVFQKVVGVKPRDYGAVSQFE
jgi:hypothetical protein